ncbi:tRNA (guanine(37)-N1)-methyltransferase-like isoform X1 [Prorops nasuta]|uniref:tRNA (guanine(37)-N1)-methyltransferase-like isoform X1 n=1 Tax=Prorops nasuta TaxID=863751 RepID=UPI0034CDCE3F
MKEKTSLLVPPALVRGMTSLDRSAFDTIVKIPYLFLFKSALYKLMPVLKKYLLKIQKLKPIQNKDKGTMVYLNPERISKFEDFTKEDQVAIKGHYDHFGTTDVKLVYENFRFNEILKAVMPQNIEAPVSFSQVGHIVHLNLRDSHLPFKSLIGQVYLDTVPRTKTVINKTNTIDTTFRHFNMEILAGEKETVTTVKENGFTYKFDFAQVYWNPRLSTEHGNLVSLLKSGDVLYDVFAGVGPFSIPAAKKGVKVYANDLNPESYKWLQKNAKINKVTEKMNFFNMDGRDFLKAVVKETSLNRRDKNEGGSEHIAMNLPSLAVEFLDVFTNWLTNDEISKICLSPPIVHLYCFVKCQKGDDPVDLAKALIEKQFNHKSTKDYLISIHNVRDVSPNKEMMCISFRLTENILRGGEPATKRLRIDEDTDSQINDTIVGNNGKEEGSAENKQSFQSSDSSQHQIKSKSSKSDD